MSHAVWMHFSRLQSVGPTAGRSYRVNTFVRSDVRYARAPWRTDLQTTDSTMDRPLAHPAASRILYRGTNGRPVRRACRGSQKWHKRTVSVSDIYQIEPGFRFWIPLRWHSPINGSHDLSVWFLANLLEVVGYHGSIISSEFPRPKYS